MSIFTEKAFNKMLSMLERMKKNGQAVIPDASSPIVKDPDANLTFAVFGDPQVSNYMFARQRCFYSACQDLKNTHIDLLAIAGDIAENGFKCEYRMVSKILNEIAQNVDNFILVPGNHDVRMRFYKRQLSVFRDFIKNTVNGVQHTGEHYYFSKEINGYTFLMMGPDRSSFESAYISKKQLEWIDAEIGKATADGKPVFVINHQALNKHHGLPDVWEGLGNWRGGLGMQSDKLKAVFEKHNNVIFITGHLHYGTYEKTFEDCGSYKSLSVQTVGASNHGSYGEESQGYVISVYDDRIEMRARLFAGGEYVPEEIPNSKIIINL